MRLLLAVLLVASQAWAQSGRPNGEPSPTVRQQQEQADHARKQHPKSAKQKEPRASLKTKETQGQRPHSKSGEAALRTPSK